MTEFRQCKPFGGPVKPPPFEPQRSALKKRAGSLSWSLGAVRACSSHSLALPLAPAAGPGLGRTYRGKSGIPSDWKHRSARRDVGTEQVPTCPALPPSHCLGLLHATFAGTLNTPIHNNLQSSRPCTIPFSEQNTGCAWDGTRAVMCVWNGPKKNVDLALPRQ